MKKLLALCLLLSCLCSCASLLEREYTVASPHEEDPPPHGDGAYRVETYPALRSALLSYVEEGLDSGLLRLPTTYPGNLAVDMEKAKRQLMEEDPLGCYALDDLTYRTSKIIAYYEVELSFTYKADKKTLRSISKAASRSDLTTLLGKALAEEKDCLCVYLTAYPEDDPDFFADALRDAWTGLEAEASGPESSAAPTQPPVWGSAPPELTVELYPQTGGARRVAELKLTPASEASEPPQGGEADG